MIRSAGLKDTVPMLIMMERFYEESDIEKVVGPPWDEAMMFKWMKWAISNPTWYTVVWDDDSKLKGMFIGELGYFLSAPTLPMGFELIWYINKENRNGRIAKKMVSGFEEWSKEHGATAVSIGSANTKRGDRTDKSFGKMGFFKGITIHFKKLQENGNEQR